MPKSKELKRKVISVENVEAELRCELRKLQRKLGLGLELRDVRWIPREGVFSGEVRDGVVYIYDKEPEKAVKTLKHEVIDQALTEILEPLVKYINLQKSLIEAFVYKRKEKLVDGLSDLL